ncbi:MAG: transposase, partial [Clostridiales Family XIII bacterium]|nr:transposase [Clostridiales Family XIII bacterium]
IIRFATQKNRPLCVPKLTAYRGGRLTPSFKLPIEDAREELKGWIGWAMRSRIPGFVESRRKIKRHVGAILSSIEYVLSNARVEAINNKIKLTVGMGYGFRNIDNLIALVMLRCANTSLTLPGRV